MKLQHIILIIIFIILVSPPTELRAQAGDKGIRMGLKLPYTYDIGYYHRFSTRIGMYVSSQIVTMPFSSSVTGLMNLYGADPKLTAILDESFGFGIGLDHGWQYHFGTDNRRYYVGLSIQWMSLLKEDINDAVIDDAFADDPIEGCETLDKCPINPMQKFNDSDVLTINTNYVNMALSFGITFPLPNNKNSEFRLEGQLAKTIASRHYLYSDFRYISPISERTNESLQDIMRKYGWFPSINLYYIYKLNF